MKIVHAEALRMKVPMEPFTVSFGTIDSLNAVLLRIVDESGQEGWGEAPMIAWPVYKPEMPETVMVLLQKVIIPFLLNKEIRAPEDVDAMLGFIKGNRFAKGIVSCALYDLYGKLTNKTLVELVGGTQTELVVSKTVGILGSPEEAVEKVGTMVAEGIDVIKLKIGPGKDLSFAQAVRKAYPDITLMVDANAAYTFRPETVALFKAMEGLNVAAIEQPLQAWDIIDHAKLQREIAIPIALDESIDSVYDAEKAIELGSCKIMNLKVPRVGGLGDAIRINKLAEAAGIGTWVGGMMELPPGYNVNMAFATMSNCRYPTDFADVGDDVPGYDTFFKSKPFTLRGARCDVKFEKPGAAIDMNWDVLEQYVQERVTLA